MKKLLRHGRNSKPSSGGGGGGGIPNTIYFDLFASTVREYAENRRKLFDYIDYGHGNKMFSGEITMDFVNGDPIDFVFYGDFESGTEIKISIDGVDTQNIDYINGQPASEYSNNWTLTTNSSTEFKGEDNISFTPKAYGIIEAVRAISSESADSGYIDISGYIGDIPFNIDVYLNFI